MGISFRGAVSLDVAFTAADALAAAAAAVGAAVF